MNESTNDQLLSVKVSTWRGRPVAGLGRQELLDCIEYLGRENTRLRQENLALFKAAKPLDLLRWMNCK